MGTVYEMENTPKTYDQNGCIRPPQILRHEGHKKILSTDTHHSKGGGVPTVFNNCPFETSTEKEVRVGPFAHLKKRDQGSKGCIGLATVRKRRHHWNTYWFCTTNSSSSSGWTWTQAQHMRYVIDFFSVSGGVVHHLLLDCSV